VSSDYLNRILLNVLENVGVFLKNDLIKIETINSGFGYKILSIGNSQKVLAHVNQLRISYPNIFSEFQDLYDAVYANSAPEERVSFRQKFIP
jgi:hypothetical protein